MNSGSCGQTSASRELPIHVVQIHHTGEQVTHWDKTNKELVSSKMVISFVCLVPVRLLLPSQRFCTTWITSCKGAINCTHQLQWWCTVESLLECPQSPIFFLVIVEVDRQVLEVGNVVKSANYTQERGWKAPTGYFVFLPLFAAPRTTTYLYETDISLHLELVSTFLYSY